LWWVVDAHVQSLGGRLRQIFRVAEQGWHTEPLRG
jgi:hypothetical protein